MKLGKTESQLIEHARVCGGHYSVECGGGRKRTGGKVSYGTRDRRAVNRLVERGLVTITDINSSYETDGGYTIRSTILSFKLNEGV